MSLANAPMPWSRRETRSWRTGQVLRQIAGFSDRQANISVSAKARSLSKQGGYLSAQLPSEATWQLAETSGILAESSLLLAPRKDQMDHTRLWSNFSGRSLTPMAFYGRCLWQMLKPNGIIWPTAIVCLSRRPASLRRVSDQSNTSLAPRFAKHPHCHAMVCL